MTLRHVGMMISPMRAILFALCLCGLGAQSANAQGMLSVSLTQQIDQNGQPLAGCLLYFFVVGTVATPQNSYQDTGLTNVNPWPLQCDQSGRVPPFFLTNGNVHIRLTSAAGTPQFDYPNMPVLSASSGGGGGGGTVDPTTVASTGDVKYRVTAETLTGWVRLNSQSIGSASSGGTERANADTQNLYVYLWNNCTNAHCPVAGGRGANGLADFNAGKAMGLPNMRGQMPVGRDCMGAACAGILAASNITSGGGDGVDTPLGAGGVANQFSTVTIAQGNLPNVNFNGSASVSGGNHSHSVSGGVVGGTSGGGLSFGGASAPLNASNITINNSGLLNMSGSATVNSGGNGTPLSSSFFNNMQPSVLVTWYIKL